jgi:branched-chain amino acid transport system ATP-binding protein
MSLISGQYKPDSGKIFFQSRNITAMKPHKICRLGVGRTFQIPLPFINLTVTQNLMIPAMYALDLNKDEAEKHASEIIEFTDLYDCKNILAKDLSTVILRRLELARALSSQPVLLILDEVLAGLTPEEIPKMLDLIRKIRKKGTTILLIEHIIEAMVEIVDRIVVIDKGAKIAEGKPKDILQNPTVIQTYLG